MALNITLKKRRFWFGLAAILTIANMVMKHWLIISAVLAAGEPVLQEMVRFYSFFTHWANFLCCLFFVGLALPSSRLGRWVSFPGIRSAMAVYMTVVAVVYHLLLSGLWQPEGLTRLADEMFHTWVPLAVVIVWLMGEPQRVPLKRVPFYLVFPSIYLAYSLIRGAFSNYYPYFFLDVAELGYRGVAVSSLGLLLAFFGLGYLFTFFANLRVIKAPQ